MTGYTEVLVVNEEESGKKGKRKEALYSSRIHINYFKVYKIRWFMLYLQIMCSACVAMQFLQFSIIANIVVDFYGVSYEAVDWSAMLFLLVYIPLIFPVMHIINKIGLRGGMLISMVGNCAGAWIKVGSVAPDRYWVILLGQLFVTATQAFVMVMPAGFASAWFSPSQVGLATGLGVFGVQFGSAIGCVIPALVVKPSKNPDDVARDLYILNIGFGVICTIFLILIFAFFKSQPLTPPSNVQQVDESSKLELKTSTKLLFTNYSFVMLLIAFGFAIGIFYAVPTLLNQIMAEYYPNSSEDAGKIGLLMLLVGMLGVTGCGYVLDKYKQHKLTTISIFASYLVSMISFTLALGRSLTAVYITAMFVGFFMTAAYSVGLEVAAELTYPIPETTSSGYLLTSAQAVGIGLIYLHSFLLYRFGAIWANSVTCVELFLATVLIIGMKFEYKRRSAETTYKRRNSRQHI